MINEIKYKEYYEEIKNQYPIINEGVRLHLWPDKTCVSARVPEHKSKIRLYNSSTTTVNPSAIKLLELCDGISTTQQIVDIIRNMDGINDDLLEEKIAKFLYNASNEYSHISFFPDGAKEKVDLVRTGSKDHYFPTHFVLEPTNNCNLKCKHCYRLKGEYDKQELSLDEIKDVIDQMNKMGAFVVEITGGECTLHKNFKEIIEYAYPRMNVLGVLTNGMNITEELVEKLNPYKDKLLWSISLDSCHEEYHDSFRGIKGAFKKTCDGIRFLVKNDHCVRVSMSITSDNIDHIKDTIDFAYNDLKVLTFGYSSILPFGRGSDLDNIGFSYEEILKIIDVRKYAQKYKGFVNFYEEDKLKNTLEHSKNCGVGWRSIVIGPNGNVRPCVMIDEEMIKFGNIREERIEDIVKKDIVKKLRNIEMPTEKSCDSCTKVSYCKGCIHRAMVANMERLDKGQNQCDWAKKNNVLDYIKTIHTNSCANKSCGM